MFNFKWKKLRYDSDIIYYNWNILSFLFEMHDFGKYVIWASFTTIYRHYQVQGDVT